MRALKRTWILGLTACSLLCFGWDAEAQFTQYTPPGGADLENEDIRERLERALETARWDLGPVRVDPWFGITDAGLQEDSGDARGSEATATVGAGFRAYLPTGPKVLWAAHVLPEYVWRDGDSERSRLNGRYGVGLFAFGNRIGVEASARRRDTQDLFSSETLERTNFRTDRLNLRTEVALGRVLSLFVEGLRLETRFLDEGDPEAGARVFSFLDRDETILRTGLRQTFSNGLAVTVGAEHSDVDFAEPEFIASPFDALDRSHSGTAPVVELSFFGNRLEAAADVAYRSLDGEPGFVPYDDLTGQAQLAFDLGWRIRTTLYGSRNLVYALERGYSYFEEDRLGLAVGVRLHRRLFATVFTEDGDATFARQAPSIPIRLDTLTRTGGELALSLPADSRFVIGLTEVETDSNLPGEDREFTFLSFGLRISTGNSPWW